METPSATRRVTRSQTQSKKFEECEMNPTKSRQRIGRKDQHALVDITNDSPIIGLAKGSFFETTPSSKKRVHSKIKICTPGSGEELLRDQVRTLLEKVEEEVEFSKISPQIRPFHMNILAPTPANTPQFPNLSNTQILELASVTPSLVQEDKLLIPQMGNGIFEGKKDLVTRELLFDFIEKFEETNEKICSDDDDDDASVWSLQVNVSSSTKDELEDDEDCIEKSVEKANEYDEDVLVNELCVGMSKINIVKEETRKIGKHTRFLYDNDGELVEVQEEIALHLNGEGKHIRFHDKEEEEEEDYSDEE